MDCRSNVEHFVIRLFNYFHRKSLFQLEVARFMFPKTTLIAVVNKAQTTAKKETRKRYPKKYEYELSELLKPLPKLLSAKNSPVC